MIVQLLFATSILYVEVFQLQLRTVLNPGNQLAGVTVRLLHTGSVWQVALHQSQFILFQSSHCSHSVASLISSQQYLSSTLKHSLSWVNSLSKPTFVYDQKCGVLSFASVVFKK